MTDDLLDEATRLAERLPVLMGGSIAETLRALVERVQQAEAERQEWADLWKRASMGVLTLQDEAKALTRERDSWHQAALTATAGESRAERERDEARGKLDKVRQVAEDTSESVSNDWGWGYDAAMERVLAILDGKTGD